YFLLSVVLDLSRLFFFHSSAPPRALHSFPTRRSSDLGRAASTTVGIDRRLPALRVVRRDQLHRRRCARLRGRGTEDLRRPDSVRSEEHTSELQSPCNLVCRLLLEKKKIR